MFVIEKDNKGIEVQDYPTVDGFKAAEVILNDVHISTDNLISDENQAYNIIQKSIERH